MKFKPLTKLKDYIHNVKGYELPPDKLLERLGMEKDQEPDIEKILVLAGCQDAIFSDICLIYAKQNYGKFVKQQYQVPDNLENNPEWSRYIMAYLLGTYHCLHLTLKETERGFFTDEEIHSAVESYVAEIMVPPAALSKLEGKGGMPLTEAAKLLNVPPHILKRRLFH